MNNLNNKSLEELMDLKHKLKARYARARADANYADGQAYYQDIAYCNEILSQIRSVDVLIEAKNEEAIREIHRMAAEAEAKKEAHAKAMIEAQGSLF